MIIDEAVRSWMDAAAEAQMRVLPLEAPLLERLEELGFRRAVISRRVHQIERRCADSRFQRLSCVHPCGRAGHHYGLRFVPPSRQEKKKYCGKKKAPYPWTACVVTRSKDR